MTRGAGWRMLSAPPVRESTARAYDVAAQMETWIMCATPHRRIVAPLLAASLVGGALCGAHAEVTVAGTSSALQVTTDNDSVVDVLTALAKSFSLRYRTAIRLDAAAGGAYSGSLGEVVGRLLEGYSYVIRREQDVLEVVVVGLNGTRPVPVRAPPPPSTNITAKWR